MVNEKVSVFSLQEPTNWYRYGKRIQDVVISVLSLLTLWPLFLVLGLIIVLDSPGAGPIFVQTRVGKDGKRFRLYKFRTMHPNAEAELDGLLAQNEMDGPVFKIKQDPRITRAGAFLRRSGLDELPQLWNVLRGDMSLVGPRPGLPREVRQYDAFAYRRLMVQPGITCYWQIAENRNSLSFDEWMALDNAYLRDMDFGTDWRILLATIKAVIRMDGQ